MDRNQLNMWTDSVVVFHWIRSTAQNWKPFVASIVTERQSLTNPELWSHCDSKINHDDLATRDQCGNPQPEFTSTEQAESR